MWGQQAKQNSITAWSSQDQWSYGSHQTEAHPFGCGNRWATFYSQSNTWRQKVRIYWNTRVYFASLLSYLFFSSCKEILWPRQLYKRKDWGLFKDSENGSITIITGSMVAGRHGTGVVTESVYLCHMNRAERKRLNLLHIHTIEGNRDWYELIKPQSPPLQQGHTS